MVLSESGTVLARNDRRGAHRNPRGDAHCGGPGRRTDDSPTERPRRRGHRRSGTEGWNPERGLQPRAERAPLAGIGESPPEAPLPPPPRCCPHPRRSRTMIHQKSRPQLPCPSLASLSGEWAFWKRRILEGQNPVLPDGGSSSHPGLVLLTIGAQQDVARRSTSSMVKSAQTHHEESRVTLWRG